MTSATPRQVYGRTRSRPAPLRADISPGKQSRLRGRTETRSGSCSPLGALPQRRPGSRNFTSPEPSLLSRPRRVPHAKVDFQSHTCSSNLRSAEMASFTRVRCRRRSISLSAEASSGHNLRLNRGSNPVLSTPLVSHCRVCL